MKNILYLIFIKCSMFSILYSQPSIELSVISAASAQNAGNYIHLQWSMGELFSTDLLGNGITITQGFHQGFDGLITSAPSFESGSTLQETLDVQVYPNPVLNFLQLKTSRSSVLRATIYDLSGKLVLTKTLQSNDQIDFRGMLPQYYVLEITEPSGQKETFKILKQN